jgi:hypothetical protein
MHKVLTKVVYRAVSGVFRTIGPPPPLHPVSVPSPAPKAGAEYTLNGRLILRKTPNIGLASYIIIPLRTNVSVAVSLFSRCGGEEREIPGEQTSEQDRQADKRTIN